MATRIYGTVQNQAWDLPANKTFYKRVPVSMPTADMEDLCDTLVESLKNLGATEVLTTAFRPTIKIGDGAKITRSDGKIFAGIIVDVQHAFGTNGYYTQLVVCSGGTMSDSPPTLASRYITRLGHMNRLMKLQDFLNSPDRR